MEQNQVTIFRNIKDTSTPFFRDIDSILVRIKEGTSKELIKQIRSEKNKEVRQELKKNLPAICFSGMFNKRNDDSITRQIHLFGIYISKWKRTQGFS